MEIVKGSLKRDSHRDTYWTRVLLTSPENKKTFIYVCASHEYLGNTLNTNKFDDTKVNGWVDDIVKEWQSKGNAIFKKPFHLEVRAVTSDGYKKGIEFLKNEVVPVAA